LDKKEYTKNDEQLELISDSVFEVAAAKAAERREAAAKLSRDADLVTT
jgi:hypothetical protein